MFGIPGDHILSSAYWIVLAPFLAALAIIVGAFRNKTLSMSLSVGTVFYGFVHSLLVWSVLAATPRNLMDSIMRVQQEWTFFACGDPCTNVGSTAFKLSMGVLTDNLSAVMLIVVTAVSLLVQIYTHGYMRHDPGYSRFYAYLSLFTGSMLGLVVATNLFQMYFFWELVGVCSYFLIGFWFQRKSAAEACLKAFIVNRIGDCGFLVGILMLFAATRDLWNGNTILAFAGTPGYTLAELIPRALASHNLGYWGLTGLFAISCVILLGPIAKSAQFPLHVWLPDAMEGPTPISALIHAATMVAAGVYLVARAYPIWQCVPDGVTGNPGLLVVACVGAFTAFMAATIAMSQFDIKRCLAWLTVSQLGYMFVGLGAGAFTGSLFHLFNHAFFKAMLFLCSGAVIHGLHGEQDMRRMGGLKDKMKGTSWCFLIGTLSISGFPPFSGFFSKDDIIGAAWAFNNFLGAVMIFTAFLTSFYMFRIYYMTFGGTYRGQAPPHNSPPVMVWPLIALAVPSVLSGLLGVNLGEIAQWLSGVPVANPFGSFVYFQSPHFEPVNPLVMGLSLGCALSGWGLAHVVYSSQTVKVNSAIAGSSNPLIAFVYRCSFNKWYFDEIYLFMVGQVLDFYRKVWQVVDMYIVDAIVNLSALVTEAFAQALRLTQTGNGQSYALVVFAGVAIFTVVAFLWRP